jgi:hypothetical protein
MTAARSPSGAEGMRITRTTRINSTALRSRMPRANVDQDTNFLLGTPERP